MSRAEQVRNFCRRGFAVEQAADALGVALEEARVVYAEMYEWRKSLLARRSKNLAGAPSATR